MFNPWLCQHTMMLDMRPYGRKTPPCVFLPSEHFSSTFYPIPCGFVLQHCWWPPQQAENECRSGQSSSRRWCSSSFVNRQPAAPCSRVWGGGWVRGWSPRTPGPSPVTICWPKISPDCPFDQLTFDRTLYHKQCLSMLSNSQVSEWYGLL